MTGDHLVFSWFHWIVIAIRYLTQVSMQYNVFHWMVRPRRQVHTVSSFIVNVLQSFNVQACMAAIEDRGKRKCGPNWSLGQNQLKCEVSQVGIWYPKSRYCIGIGYYEKVSGAYIICVWPGQWDCWVLCTTHFVKPFLPFSVHLFIVVCAYSFISATLPYLFPLCAFFVSNQPSLYVSMGPN